MVERQRPINSPIGNAAQTETRPTNIEIGSDLGAVFEVRRSGDVSGLFGQYRALALTALIVLVITVSPILVASNRPDFWMLWTTVLFLSLAVYLASLAILDERLSFPLRSLKITGGAAFLFIGYAIAQSIELPIPPEFKALPARPDITNRTISITPDATRLAAFRWATYAVFFFLCIQVARNRRRARFLGWVGFTVVGLQCGYAILSFRYLGDIGYLGPENGYHDFVTGTFINRNSFATFVGMGFILGLSLLLRETFRPTNRHGVLIYLASKDGLKSIVLWCLLGVLFFSLVGSASRMGMIATGVGSVLVTAIVLRKYRAGSNVSIGKVLGWLALLMAVGTLVFGETLLERAIYIQAESRSRIDLYSAVVDLIQLRPLLGFGLDSFEIAFQQVHEPPVSSDYLWDRAHSTYLTLWSESGILFGSLPILIVLIIGVRLAFKDMRQDRDAVFSIAALGVILQTGLHSLVDFSMEMPANIYLFLFILALAFARDPGPASSRRNP
jgi:O-antigen ligase